MMLSVVVLPQPEGPTNTTNSPSAMSRLTPAHRLGLAEALDDGVEPDAAHRRIIPKLKPFTRCFWIRKPKITTGMVTTVPMAACGP